MRAMSRWLRRTAAVIATILVVVVVLIADLLVVFWFEGRGTPSPTARGTGHDAIWLGHAWVDGRKTQSDVDALAARLRTTGIRDLYVHTGPFENDGTLRADRRPTARWFIGAIHTALPGVRVQAWLGAHPGDIDLESARPQLLASVDQVLGDGFDGVHYDFEPVEDGDASLLELLRATRPITQLHRALLSISATRGEPWPGVAAAVTAIPGKMPIWSGAYLRRVALEVDQVAVMSYDSGMFLEPLYAGYVRTSTRIAIAAVPSNVDLLIGVPAYHETTTYHRPAETIAAGIHGVRLAMGDRKPPPHFGVAIYVDFTITPGDWSAYERDWFSG